MHRVVIGAEVLLLIGLVLLIVTSGVEHAAVMVVGITAYICGLHDAATKPRNDEEADS